MIAVQCINATGFTIECRTIGNIKSRNLLPTRKMSDMLYLPDSTFFFYHIFTSLKTRFGKIQQTRKIKTSIVVYMLYE